MQVFLFVYTFFVRNIDIDAKIPKFEVQLCWLTAKLYIHVWCLQTPQSALAVMIIVVYARMAELMDKL